MKNVNLLMTGARPLMLALAGVGLAATLAACDDATGKAAQPPATAGAPAVSVATVVEKPVAETEEFSGHLEAIERVQIRPRVGGFITAVNIKPGAQVRKGDVLFVIDPRPLQAEADRANAAAQAARARAELARLELDRAEKLVGALAISRSEYEERAASQKELDAAARAAQAQSEAARLNLSYTRVTAPINGRVSKEEITLGNLVDTSTVLTSVVSEGRIYASFDGDEQTYLRVAGRARSGKPILVRAGLANEEGFPHEGRLEFVDNQLDTATGSVRMRAVFANEDRRMAPGLFARVQVGGGDARKEMLITDRAVGTDQSHKFVFVVDPHGKAQYREVELGPVVDGLRVVREGLKPGEKIVVNGLQRVKPGTAVSATDAPMMAGALPASGNDATLSSAATGRKE